MTLHWPIFFTWWMVGGAILYGLIWWRILTRGAKAWFSFITSFPLVLYWFAPSICYFGLKWGLWAVISGAIVYALVGMAPMQAFWRAQGREREAAKQARADEAEQIIERLGYLR